MVHSKPVPGINKRQIILEIFLEGIDSVKPDNLIARSVSLDQDILQIENLRFDLSGLRNIYIVGAGKASASMARAIETILGSKITAGHIITKYGHAVPLKFVEITEAGHPVPDENGIKGTDQVISLLKKADKEDLVICLLSGGGSSLLIDVPEGCTLRDLKILTDILIKSGATINEINCIRKHLSKVKGGLLSKTAFPARVVTLILSDVIGDPLDVIASGPTAADPTTYSDAIALINKYNIRNDLPVRISEVLQEGLDKKRQETLKESDEALLLTKNVIIGNNVLVLNRAKEKSASLGYETQIITNKLAGDISEVASYIMELAKQVKKENINRSICLLFAGEPTVKVKGKGLGGRNQHLALIIARLLKNIPGIVFLSGGTDGSDGPTDATGAVTDSLTTVKASEMHLNIDQYIGDFDSYNFFKQVGGLIKTGPTQTNVMDLMIVLIN